MQILTEMENCSYTSPYTSDIAESKIVIKLQIGTIVSTQSRKNVIDNNREEIQKELTKFQWIITESILLQFAWYLDSVIRQETPKYGDMDNISKPIQDALTGVTGIIVDDSQIRNFETLWMSKNAAISGNILRIEIRFLNNDAHNLCSDKYNT